MKIVREFVIVKRTDSGGMKYFCGSRKGIFENWSDLEKDATTFRGWREYSLAKEFVAREPGCHIVELK